MRINELKFKMDGIQFEFKLKDKLIIVIGDSGVGKTYLYEILKKLGEIKPNLNIININIDSIKLCNIKEVIKNSQNSLIVIDNAALLLDMATRVQISMDNKNQYIIFTHDTAGFKANTNTFVKLVIENNKGYFDYVME